GETVADPDALGVAEAVHVREGAQVGHLDEDARFVVLVAQVLADEQRDFTAVAAHGHLHGTGSGRLEGRVHLVAPGKSRDSAYFENSVAAEQARLFSGRSGLDDEKREVARFEAVITGFFRLCEP